MFNDPIIKKTRLFNQKSIHPNYKIFINVFRVIHDSEKRTFFFEILETSIFSIINKVVIKTTFLSFAITDFYEKFQTNLYSELTLLQSFFFYILSTIG